jgi:glutamyl endopeptidase
MNSLTKVLVAGAGVCTMAAMAAPAAALQADDGTGATTITAGSVTSTERRAASSSGHATQAYAGSAPSPERSVIGNDGRSKVTDTTLYPSRAIGQIELTQNGEPLICTGWLIDANSILTSGHCSYNPGNDIIEAATFAPGRNALVDPYGTCPVYEVMSPAGWRVEGRAAHDWSVMQLGTNDGVTITPCNVGETTGWLGIFYKNGTKALAGLKATVRGYPGDKAFGTMWTMKGTIAGSTKSMAYYPMDTFGGQSGSPVFQLNRAACGGPCGAAIHSYGQGLPGLGSNNNAGPRITEARFDTITAYAAENG